MDDESRLGTGISSEAPIEIVAYDPSWPARFDEECGALRHALASWLAGPIEHIGSTAIPGIAAKPVIDVMAAVESLEGSKPAIEAAASMGYCYFPYKAHLEHWFCKPSPAFRTHHLHLVPVGSRQWVGPLAFRNYLRAHVEIASEYERLKRTLAETFTFDREAYTQGKAPFIEAITEQALAAGYAVSS
jgi:GrpB-like predicted nucleotidyltransferase (UPF0157 family)